MRPWCSPSAFGADRVCGRERPAVYGDPDGRLHHGESVCRQGLWGDHHIRRSRQSARIQAFKIVSRSIIGKGRDIRSSANTIVVDADSPHRPWTAAHANIRIRGVLGTNDVPVGATRQRRPTATGRGRAGPTITSSVWTSKSRPRGLPIRSPWRIPTTRPCTTRPAPSATASSIRSGCVPGLWRRGILQGPVGRHGLAAQVSTKRIGERS